MIIDFKFDTRYRQFFIESLPKFLLVEKFSGSCIGGFRGGCAIPT